MSDFKIFDSLEAYQADLAQELERAMDVRKTAPRVPDRRRPLETARYGRCLAHGCTYADGNPAVQIVKPSDPDPQIGTLSVNLPEVAHLFTDDRYFLAKTWSENQELAADALASGLFEDTGVRVPTGFVEAQLWRWKV